MNKLPDKVSSVKIVIIQVSITTMYNITYIHGYFFYLSAETGKQRGEQNNYTQTNPEIQ